MSSDEQDYLSPVQINKLQGVTISDTQSSEGGAAVHSGGTPSIPQSQQFRPTNTSLPLTHSYKATPNINSSCSLSGELPVYPILLTTAAAAGSFSQSPDSNFSTYQQYNPPIRSDDGAKSNLNYASSTVSTARDNHNAVDLSVGTSHWMNSPESQHAAVKSENHCQGLNTPSAVNAAVDGNLKFGDNIDTDDTLTTGNQNVPNENKSMSYWINLLHLAAVKLEGHSPDLNTHAMNADGRYGDKASEGNTGVVARQLEGHSPDLNTPAMNAAGSYGDKASEGNTGVVARQLGSSTFGYFNAADWGGGRSYWMHNQKPQLAAVNLASHSLALDRPPLVNAVGLIDMETQSTGAAAVNSGETPLIPQSQQLHPTITSLPSAGGFSTTPTINSSCSLSGGLPVYPILSTTAAAAVSFSQSSDSSFSTYQQHNPPPTSDGTNSNLNNASSTVSVARGNQNAADLSGGMHHWMNDQESQQAAVKSENHSPGLNTSSSVNVDGNSGLGGNIGASGGHLVSSTTGNGGTPTTLYSCASGGVNAVGLSGLYATRSTANFPMAGELSLAAATAAATYELNNDLINYLNNMRQCIPPLYSAFGAPYTNLHETNPYVPISYSQYSTNSSHLYPTSYGYNNFFAQFAIENAAIAHQDSGNYNAHHENHTVSSAASTAGHCFHVTSSNVNERPNATYPANLIFHAGHLTQSRNVTPTAPSQASSRSRATFNRTTRRTRRRHQQQSNPRTNRAFVTPNSEIVMSKQRVFIWALDETIILFESLLSGDYANRHAKDPEELLTNAFEMLKMIIGLADTRFFAKDIVECYQVHIDDVSSADNGQNLSDYNFASDGFLPGAPPGNRGGADRMRKLAFRYRKIKEIYSTHRENIMDLLGENSAAWFQVRAKIEQATGNWATLVCECLKIIQQREDCTNVLVTTVRLAPVYAKVLLFGLGGVFPIDNIYSALKIGHKACYERILTRFTTNSTYVVIGNSPDEESAANTLHLPFWRIAGHKDIRRLFMALKMEYL